MSGAIRSYPKLSEAISSNVLARRNVGRNWSGCGISKGQSQSMFIRIRKSSEMTRNTLEVWIGGVETFIEKANKDPELQTSGK
jgi:hypothetical protein